MAKGKSPRTTALQILTRIQDGAWADQLLKHHLSAVKMDARDKRFITQLVFGVLRQRKLIDYYLAELSNRPLGELDPPVLNALRLGAYQILRLRVPEYAACDRTVEAVREIGFSRASGFVNGVLRNFIRKKDQLEIPARENNLIQWLAVKYSHPEWIIKRWVDSFGERQAEELCIRNNSKFDICLRVNRLKTTPGDLLDRLTGKDVAVSPAPWAPEALIFEDEGTPVDLEEFSEGLFSIQAQAPQLAVRACGVTSQMRCLDMCAGVGGKTTYLAEMMNDNGEIMAVDIHKNKLNKLEQDCTRLDITSSVKTKNSDARKLTQREIGLFDIVLVDAPCSGTGIFGRRPDARWNKSADLSQKMVKLQSQLLNAASNLVAPGGALVYCTCSLAEEENEQRIHAFLNKNPDFAPDALNEYLPEIPELAASGPDVHDITMFPHVHGTDGFYIARLRRLER